MVNASEDDYPINDPIGRAALQGYRDAVAKNPLMAEHYSDKPVDLPGWPSPIEGFSNPREAYVSAYYTVFLKKQMEN